jgi:hypothetical protein
LYKLVADADVLVTNYHPSVLADLRMTYDELATGYRVEGALSLTPGTVQPSDIGQLREFLLAVERHLDRRLEVP